MAASKPKRPRELQAPVPQQANTLDGMQRSISVLEDLFQARTPRSAITIDLVIGDNRIPHGLGRKSRGANVSPTTANAAFGFSHAPDGDLIAVITVVGVAQPGATVEIY